MTNLICDFFRPFQKPSAGLPFGARSVGHYRLDLDFHSTTKIIQWVHVFWGIRGTGAIVMDGVELRLGPAQVAVYMPGMEQCYYSLSKPWEYWWWTVDGPLAVSITTAFGLTKGNVYDAGPPPLRLFRHLEFSIRNITPVGERRAATLAFDMLSRAATSHPLPGRDLKIQAALDIIHREWNDPSLCVDVLSTRLRLHRSSFSRRFHAVIGISPVTYIINLRIQNALNRLKATDKPAGEIAHDCGWTDPAYFSRCIRRATGCSPKTFRRQ